MSRLLAGVCVFILSASMPMIFGFLFLFVFVFTKKHLWFSIAITLIVYSFALMNFNKEIVGDLLWYSDQYLNHYGNSFKDIFDGYISGVKAKETEPLYHIVSYLLSNLFNANYFVFVLGVTFLVYIPAVISIVYIARYFRLNELEKVFLVVFFIFFSLVFTQSIHLIRQYIACSLFLLFLCNLLDRKYYYCIFFSLLSILTHNSMLVVVIIVAAVYFLLAYLENSGRGVKVLVVATVTTVFSFAYIGVFYLIGSGHALSINDGSVSAVVKLTDILLFMISAFFVTKVEIGQREINRLWFLYLAFCVFILCMHFSLFLSLRYYFYMDFFRWIPIAVILYSVGIKREMYLLMLPVIISLGILHVDYRVAVSPFYYGGSIFSYIFYPFNSLW